MTITCYCLAVPRPLYFLRYVQSQPVLFTNFIPSHLTSEAWGFPCVPGLSVSINEAATGLVSSPTLFCIFSENYVYLGLPGSRCRGLDCVLYIIQKRLCGLLLVEERRYRQNWDKGKVKLKQVQPRPQRLLKAQMFPKFSGRDHGLRPFGLLC
jgi:hypothetical protein